MKSKIYRAWLLEKPLYLVMIFFLLYGCVPSQKNDNDSEAIQTDQSIAETVEPPPGIPSAFIGSSAKMIKKHWNLVSFPVTSSTSIQDLMESDDQYDHIQSVWHWDGSDWKVFPQTDGFGLLDTVTPDNGYWIRSRAKFEFTGTGTSNNLYNFKAGWNLIGYSHSGSPTSMGDFFGDGDYWSESCGDGEPVISAWAWRGNTWEVYFPNDNDRDAFNQTHGTSFEKLDNLEPGEGIWVNASRNNEPPEAGICPFDCSNSNGQPSTSSDAPTLMLIGGAHDWSDDSGKEIACRFIQEAGGVGVAQIGVISASSGDPEGSGATNVERLKAGGVDAEWIPITQTSGNANDTDVVAQIEKMSGFYFTGGDQSRYIRALFNSDGTDTLAMAAIRTRIAAGAPAAGTSAGTAVQTSAPMVTGGAPVSSLLNPSQTYQPLQTTVTSSDGFLNYRPEGGLGFFTHGLLDTHFSERGRQGRIIRLALETDTDHAFGVDENTSLIVKAGQMEVLGEGGVFIFDVSNATNNTNSEGVFSASGVKATYLNSGDQYDPSTQNVTYGFSTALDTTLNATADADDSIFEGTTFLETSKKLLQSDKTEAAGETFDPGDYYFRVVLNQDSNTTGQQNSEGSKVSYHDLNVTIDAVETPWTARANHSSVLFPCQQDKAFNCYWVLGGNAEGTLSNEVWFSKDGVSWRKAGGTAAWSARDGHATVVFDSKLWVIGGSDGASELNDVWFSEDGVNWVQSTTSNDWAARQGHAVVRANKKLFLLGGGSTSGGTTTAYNDVWSSIDGTTWAQVTNAADWDVRAGHAALVVSAEDSDDTIWLLGGNTGTDEYNDVWSSTDGASWTAATTSANWSSRTELAAGYADGKLWILGGAEEDASNQMTYSNDVWSSSDGVSWTDSSANNHWSAQAQHTVLVADERLVVLGGKGDNYSNEVWSSTDGTSWNSVSKDTIWEARYAHASFVFDNKMWIIGGRNAESFNDVWSTSDGKAWTRVTDNAPWLNRDDHVGLVFPCPNSSDECMWILGGRADGSGTNEVWYSSNGADWTEVTPIGNIWDGRYAFSGAVHPCPTSGDCMWIMAGRGAGDYSDVWYSPDGINWTQATAEAEWYAASGDRHRRYTSTESFNGALWFMGGWDGNTSHAEVWTSTDGATWTEATTSSTSLYDGRDTQDSAIFKCPDSQDQCLWVMGGYPALNDVWYSSDGVTWTEAAEPGWSGRNDHQAVVFQCPDSSDSCLWVLGGTNDKTNFAEAWYTADGASWTQVSLGLETHVPPEVKTGTIYDDFNSGEISSVKWFISGDTPQIVDGVLHADTSDTTGHSRVYLEQRGFEAFQADVRITGSTGDAFSRVRLAGNPFDGNGFVALLMEPSGKVSYFIDLNDTIYEEEIIAVSNPGEFHTLVVGYDSTSGSMVFKVDENTPVLVDVGDPATIAWGTSTQMGARVSGSSAGSIETEIDNVRTGSLKALVPDLP